MNRKFKIISALVLALILCLSSVAVTLAEGEPEGAKGKPGTPDEPAQAAITKHLKVPVGTIIPDLSYTFTIKPLYVVDSTNLPPSLNGGSNQFSLGFDAAFAASATPDANGILNLKKQTGDIFAGIKWPHAGVYVYELEEDKTTNSDLDPLHHFLTFSKAKYELYVYVMEGENENRDTTFFIYAIGALIVVGEDGENNNIEKVDPNPGTPGVDNTYSKMAFVNTYMKVHGPTDPENPDTEDPDGQNSTLAVSKAISGDFASGDASFPFTISITTPIIDTTEGKSFKGYVLEGSKIIQEIIVASGATDPTPFTLKAGQKLVFFNTPVGASYTVTELATAYKPGYVINGTGGESKTTSNVILSTGNQYVVDEETGSVVAYTNTRDDITPTGLNLNDLPFIGMIALALLGTMGYIIVKANKRKSYN